MIQINERDKEFYRNVSNYINNFGSHEKEVADLLARDHRYLVGKMFQMCLWFIARLAKDYRKKRYDERNKWACKVADNIMSHLLEDGTLRQWDYGMNVDDNPCSIDWVDYQ